MRFLVADKAPGQSVHHRGHCRVCTSTDFLKFLSRTRTSLESIYQLRKL